MVVCYKCKKPLGDKGNYLVRKCGKGSKHFRNYCITCANEEGKC